MRHHARSNVECDALLIDETSRTDTYPYIEIEEDDANVGHEASVSKIGEEQLFYLMSRGVGEEEAMAMIVRGFIEPIAKELPLEYAVELNRLIELGRLCWTLSRASSMVARITQRDTARPRSAAR